MRCGHLNNEKPFSTHFITCGEHFLTLKKGKLISDEASSLVKEMSLYSSLHNMTSFTIELAGLTKTFQGLAFSPLLGFLGAFLVMLLLLWIFARARPRLVSRLFGRLQILSAAWMAFSHGGNDAQKTMGVITMALASYYGWTGSQWQVPLWVILTAATSMGLGTAIGGWRIIRTVGLKVVDLRPINGFAAETAAAAFIETASRLGIPVSTTHVISSAILGVGATKRLSAVRWGIAGRIVMAWVLTIPSCIILGWGIYYLLHLITGVR